MSAEKGHKYLIKAFSTKNRDWKLALIGDGSQRQSLEKLVSDLSLKDRVIFLGHLTTFQIQHKLKYLYYPLREGFPTH